MKTIVKIVFKMKKKTYLLIIRLVTKTHLGPCTSTILYMQYNGVSILNRLSVCVYIIIKRMHTSTEICDQLVVRPIYVSCLFFFYYLILSSFLVSSFLGDLLSFMKTHLKAPQKRNTTRGNNNNND